MKFYSVKTLRGIAEMSAFFAKLSVASFLGLALLAGCIKPKEAIVNSETITAPPEKGRVPQPPASFYHEVVNFEVSVFSNVPKFSIPNAKLYTFHTCLKDRRTNEPLIGHQFIIRGGAEEVVERTRDNGCLFWTERVAFNAVVPKAKFIPLRRQIVGTGIHTGLRNLYIAINPWSKTGGADAFRDLDNTPVPDEQLASDSEAASALLGKTGSGDIQLGRLWMDDLRTNITHDPNAPTGRLEFQAVMTPEILQRNVVGQPDNLILNDGTFRVEFWLLGFHDSAPTEKKCAIMAKSRPRIIRVEAARLRDQVAMIKNVHLSLGQYQLIARIEVVDSAVPIAPFSGAWMVGDHDNLLNMKFNQPLRRMYDDAENLANFEARDYVNGCRDLTPEASALGLAAGPRISDTLPNLGRPDPVTGSYIGPFGRLGPVDQYKPLEPLPLSEKDRKHIESQRCVRPEHIPYLFPYDRDARTIAAGSDLLTCASENLPSGLFSLERFEFGVIRIGEGITAEPILTGRETNTERRLAYLVNLPVMNPLTKQPIRDVEFEITTLKPEPRLTDQGTVVVSVPTTVKRRTNIHGRLVFNDEVFHTYYKEERFILRIIQIRHVASGFTRKLLLVINPWDNNGFTFGRDLRAISPDKLVNINVELRDKSRLLITGFSWNTYGFQYNVDDLMNLRIYKTFIITLVPRVLRYSSLVFGRAANEPLRDGLYLMRYALQKDYKPVNEIAREYISGNQKLVRVTEGRIVTNVTFDFADFRVLKLRSRLMIELVAVEERALNREEFIRGHTEKSLNSIIKQNSGLDARTFIGPVVAYNNGFSGPMRPLDDLTESFCRQVDCGQLKTNASEILAESVRKQKLAAQNMCDQDGAIRYGAQSKGTGNPKVLVPGEEADGYECESEEKFFDSITHLAGKTAKDMLDRLPEVFQIYQAEQKALASLKRYFEYSNTELVSLGDGPGSVYQDFVSERLSQKELDPGPQTMRTLVDHSLRSWRTRYPNRNELSKTPYATLDAVWLKQSYEEGLKSLGEELFDHNQPMTIPTMAMFCPILIEKVIFPIKPGVKKTKMGESLLENCRGAVHQAMNVELRKIEDAKHGILRPPDTHDVNRSPISIERFYRTRKVGYSTRGRGNLLVLNVGASAGLDTGKSGSFSYGFSPLAALESLVKLGLVLIPAGVAGAKALIPASAAGALTTGAAGAAVAGARGLLSGPGLLGAFKTFGKLLLPNQFFVDKTGISISMGQSISDSQSRGTGVSTGLSLAVELRSMDLHLEQYERCAHIRLRKPFIEFHLADLIAKQRVDFFDVPDLDRRLVPGLTICEGKVLNQPKRVHERYYMFSQALGEEVMNDPTALENQPYMLGVRGRSDYKRIVSILEAEVKGTRMLPRVNSIAETPFDRMDHAMDPMEGATPTFGGILRIEPDTFGPVPKRRLPEERRPWNDPLIDKFDQMIFAPSTDPQEKEGVFSRLKRWIMSY